MARPQVVFILKGENGFALRGVICAELIQGGFRILRWSECTEPNPAVNLERWGRHYAEHVGKPFYDGTVSEMASGPHLVILCEYAGPGDAYKVADAAKTWIRARWAPDPQPKCQNVIHASDSAKAAAHEAQVWFGAA